MAEHLSQETLTRYEGRALSPAELLAADDHLAECAACRERLEGRSGAARAAIVESLSAESAATPLTHLDYEQLEAVVDGIADEVTRETVSSHTAVCAACADELNELMALRDQLQARGAWRREGESAVVSLNEYQERRASQRKARIAWPRWAAAAAALAVCALVAWLALRPTPTPEVAGIDQNRAGTAPANSNQQAETNRN